NFYSVELIVDPRDTSHPPAHITNEVGEIWLGCFNGTNGSEYLGAKEPLLRGFDIRIGSVNFTVPSVEPRNDYFIVLFGDSGNSSPLFAIRGEDLQAASVHPFKSTPPLLSIPMAPMSKAQLLGWASSCVV
ncbi:hypothetical protein MPER_02981, partial [Moniliophthora perniciosa FA553]